MKRATFKRINGGKMHRYEADTFEKLMFDLAQDGHIDIEELIDDMNKIEWSDKDYHALILSELRSNYDYITIEDTEPEEEEENQE